MASPDGCAVAAGGELAKNSANKIPVNTNARLIMTVREGSRSLACFLERVSVPMPIAKMIKVINITISMRWLRNVASGIGGSLNREQESSIDVEIQGAQARGSSRGGLDMCKVSLLDSCL